MCVLRGYGVDCHHCYGTPFVEKSQATSLGQGRTLDGSTYVLLKKLPYDNGSITKFCSSNNARSSSAQRLTRLVYIRLGHVRLRLIGHFLYCNFSVNDEEYIVLVCVHWNQCPGQIGAQQTGDIWRTFRISWAAGRVGAGVTIRILSCQQPNQRDNNYK